ncbi:MAG: ABC-type branched-chain amino acid transport system periplasmic subunit [Bacteroidetes bacterium]|nr:ABC-type branched-chain amino acid transport system periplasmic subunit [Bacteroidota bacterium]
MACLGIHELLDAARRYEEEGKVLHAGQVYWRLMKAAPDLEEPYLRLAAIFLDEGHAEEAERILRRGARTCSDSTHCLTVLSDHLLRRSDYSGALECLAPLLTKRLPQVHLRAAVALMHLGKMAGAEAEIRKALTLESRLPQAREVLGEILLATRRPGEAAAELKRALRISPYNGWTHQLLGQAYLQNRNLMEALDAFQMAVNLDPLDARAWHLCGEVLLRLRRLNEAEVCLRRALDLDPQSAETSVIMGELSLQKGDMEHALAAFDTALRLHPGHQRAMDGRLHARMRELRLAERLSLLLLAFLVGWFSSLAQVSTPGDREIGDLFSTGVVQYQSGQFREAAETFGTLTTSYPGNKRITAAIIMRGKALFQLGENLESARAVRTILTDYPRSRYTSDAHVVLGNIYRRIGRQDDAMTEMIRAWETMVRPEPPRLAAEIVEAIDTLASTAFTPAHLRSLIPTTSDQECQAFLWLKIAENEAAGENTLRSRLALDTLLQMYPAERTHPRVTALLNRLTKQSDVRLGVVLPLMRNGAPTAAKEIAQEVLEGVSFAVERYMADPYHRISVVQVTRDTERDPLVADRVVRELAADDRVVAVIGPVFSSSAVAAARAAAELNLPLITPTANANGIAALGSVIFQANPDYEMRGRAMAQFAVKRRKCSRLAILAPSDSYGKFLAEAFSDEVHRLGARVVSTEWYERGSADLKRQLGNIRRAGLRIGADPMISFGGKKKLGELMKLAGLGVPVHRLDSLMHKGASVSAISLIGSDAAAKLDSIGIDVVYDESLADSLDIPVTTIDGLYIPISAPGEIGIVSSQVTYFNLHTQLLGSGEWNNLPELDASRRYCTGVFFESDAHADTALSSYRGWLTAFQSKYKKRPAKHTLYGYDTAELVLQTIRGGATTRQGFGRALAEVREFQGLHSKVGFSQRRVNVWLSILQFDGRNVLRVDEIQTE